MHGAPAFRVTERGSVIEVEGRSSEEVLTALRLLEAAHREQRAHVDSFGAGLLTAMVSAGVDVAPQASLAQAKRQASLRARLLDGGVHTHASLTQLRGGAKESSVRTWVTRRRGEHALLAVTHEGRTVIPAFQLDDHGGPRPELRPLIATLTGAGITGWEAWAWLCSRSSLLSGDVPEQVARSAPERVLRAARRHVDQLAPASTAASTTE